MTYTQDLTRIGAAADEQVADLIARAEDAEDELRVAQQLLAQQVLPATVYGSSTGKHGFAEFTVQAGRPLIIRRSYDNPLPARFAQSTAFADIGRNLSALSLYIDPHDFNASALQTFLASVPNAHDLRLIVTHEPDSPAKKIDPVEFKNMQVTIGLLVDQANVTRAVPIRFGGCLTAWTPFKRGQEATSVWWPGPNVWDFCAFDGYGDLDRSPAAVFDPAIQWCYDNKVRFAIGECGCPVSAAGPKRVAWINTAQQLAHDNDAEFCCYWDGAKDNYYLWTQQEFKAVVDGYQGATQ